MDFFQSCKKFIAYFNICIELSECYNILYIYDCIFYTSFKNMIPCLCLVMFLFNPEIFFTEISDCFFINPLL